MDAHTIMCAQPWFPRLLRGTLCSLADSTAAGIAGRSDGPLFCFDDRRVRTLFSTARHSSVWCAVVLRSLVHSSINIIASVGISASSGASRGDSVVVVVAVAAVVGITDSVRLAIQ